MTDPSPTVTVREGASTGPAVIRAGDPVIVEQRSGILDAHFEAVALQTAAIGEPLRVRLAKPSLAQNPGGANSQGFEAWGKVIRVIAVARGKTNWQEGPNTIPDSSFARGGLQP